MTTNSNESQLCQNVNCKSLRRKVKILSEIVKDAQIVLDDITTGTIGCRTTERGSPRLPSHLKTIAGSVDGDDDTQSAIVEGGDDPDIHKKICCPHANCKGKPLYQSLYSMRRHFASHLVCNKQCLMCGTLCTTIRNYMIHFDKCKKKAKEIQIDAAQEVVDELQQEIRRNLNQLHKSRTSLGGVDADAEADNRKRRAEMPQHPSQRKLIRLDDSTLTSNVDFVQTEAFTLPVTNYSSNSQPRFPSNSILHSTTPSWDTYGSEKEVGSLGNIAGPVYASLNGDVASLGGLQAQSVYQSTEGIDASFDAPILHVLSAPSYDWGLERP